MDGAAGERILALQRRYDPKLAAMGLPHVTLAGSSGVGPVLAGTKVAEGTEFPMRLEETLDVLRAMAPKRAVLMHIDEVDGIG